VLQLRALLLLLHLRLWLRLLLLLRLLMATLLRRQDSRKRTKLRRPRHTVKQQRATYSAQQLKMP
jgi:hypothetical protein